ncbi:TonB-dependent receptor [Mucilaginibacter gynuensis]|uniref:TonB-dependent receptor n=2 Tax=Mucilaginibacter gynuensis TaxID=1302236 RepID=A0ABP8G6F8_9SPHI
MAASSNAQILQKKISVTFRDESLSAALQRLNNSAQISLAYDGTALGIHKFKIKARSFKNTVTNDILTYLLYNTGIVFKENDAGIVLSPKPPPVKYGSIKGRVVDFETSDPLPGATVQIIALKKGITTDANGYYKLHNIPEGKHTITVSFTGFEKSQLDNVQVSADKETIIDVKLKAGNALSELVVSGTSRRKVINATDAELVAEVRQARSVVSGVSNEQIVRSMDRDAAEVVKRVAGVSVNNDRFVVVRGLNQRYNVTFINNNLAPSTESDSRAFSYDLISSNIIDRMLVYKSPAPDLPGEFAGGVVKIYTKNAMPTQQIDIQVSTQYRPGSSFADFNTYQGGKFDLLGFDDGTRRLPDIPSSEAYNYLNTAENTKYAKKFKNIYGYTNTKTNVDKRMLFNYYDSWRVFGKRLNNLSSVNYTQTYDHNLISRQMGNTDAIRNYSEADQSVENVRLSLIQTNSITIRDSSKIELKHFVNQSGQDRVLLTVGSKDGFFDSEEKRVDLAYRSRFLYSGQLSGSLFFNKGKTHATGNAGFSAIRQNEPDFREILYSRRKVTGIGPFDENPNESWRQGGIEGGFQRRMYTKINENAYLASGDIEHTLSNGWLLKAGTLNEFKNRDLGLRTFSPIQGPNFYGTEPVVTEDRVQEAYQPDNFRADGTGYIMREFTSPNDSYIAVNQNHSGYAALNVPLLHNKLDVYGGMRVEYNRLRIVGSERLGQAPFPIVVNQPITSFLPSVNITYKPQASIVIRGAYGKTVNRPEFREIAPFSYFDFVNLQTYNGNPDLTTANIQNFDLRFELYPASLLKNEMINLGVFYKTIDHPIEAVFDYDKNTQRFYPDIRYRNTSATKIYGAEAELRKNLSFIAGDLFRNLSLIVNGAYIYSRVNVPGTEFTASNTTPRKRPLQGQAPYIINTALSYENSAWGTKATITYFAMGSTLQFVGNNDFTPKDGTPPSAQGNSLGGFADVFQAPRNLLDFAITQRISKTLQIKAGVQDILNNAIMLYEDQDRNFKYNKEVMLTDPQNGSRYSAHDSVFSRFRPGSYYSISFNFIF